MYKLYARNQAGSMAVEALLAGDRVRAIERLRAVLRSELGAISRFTLREENALSVDYAELARELGPPIVLVGNLPYQIASPLLFCFLAARPLVRRIVVMLQREVADRLLAQPGTDDYSALSAQVQLVARVRRVCHVGRGGFIPAPRIDSTVVLLEPQAETVVPVRDLNRYSQVVRAAFGQRRKTLRNALGSVFGEAALPALTSAGIDPARRGETLNIADFARLADALHGAGTAESADREPG